MGNDERGPTDAAREPRASALSPFRHAIFRNVWIANVVSQFGGLIQTVGASWLMLQLAASAEMVTLVQASTSLPIVLFALIAGALADNFDRRQVMLAAQVFMLAVSIVLAATAFLDLVTPWLLLLLTFLIGCGQAFNGPAWQSSVGRMVPREDLPTAVAMNSMGFNIARSVGPAIGGLIVAAFGAAVAFAVNALTYIGIIGVLARWRPAPEPRLLPRERLGTAIAAGIRYVAMSPIISATLLRGFVFGFGASSIAALMPLVARDLVAGGPITYGLLLGAFGVGAVGGAFASPWLRRSLRNEWIVRAALIVFGGATVLTAVSTWLIVTLIAMMLCGASWVLALATFNSTVQTSAPRWVVGRALSQYQVVTFGGIALGSWIWGIATERYGLSAALAMSAVITLANVVLGRRFAVQQTETLNLDPLARWKEPEVALEIQPRSGPIVVNVEYRIRESDILKFLTLMAERRRIRLRDGARRWQLLRDLAEPEVWIERYQSPTWLDYVRQNQRVTHDDAAIVEQLRALHIGPEPPRVRRMIERQITAATTHAREPQEAITGPPDV
ncbi:MAG: MFS transporter [Gammaproteobacteria bacterium]|nr:MFS transporter [Gammaproteobacteria bacterium]